MAQETSEVPVYLEVGRKRTFAVALDWPGWARSGRDEAAALQALCDFGPRYARVLERTGLGFRAPPDVSALVVVERLAGNAGTDFGAPGQSLPGDAEPVTPEELERWETVLQACWRAFDGAAQAAAGKELRKGPRGGGRELEKVVEHVYESDASYLRSLGGTLEKVKDDTPDEALARVRQALLTTLGAAARGEIAARGPRGGLRWTPHFFARYVAWHELDHTWEIEDRIIDG